MHRQVLTLLMLAGTGCAAANSAATTAPDAPASPISLDELRRDVYAFSADSFAGRETGTPYGIKAARFLADRFMALGLEPAGDSLYYQRVPLVRATFAPATRFTVTEGARSTTLRLGDDVVPLVNLGPGAPLPRRNAEGDVFFAGYGMVDQGRNDFAGLTEPGRVIVILHGAPPSVTDTAVRTRLESQDELAPRIGRALQFSPAAVVLLMTGKAATFYTQAAPELLRSVTRAPGDQSTSDAQRPLPMVVLGMAREGSALLPSDWQTTAAPRALGKRLSARIEIDQQTFTAANVVGIVRGTDPRFNKTYVALGSHYDHIGIQHGMSPDSIANGADDDASGTMAMLAVARALQANKPKRSVIFVLHTGEEKGLLGSAAFTDRPTVPIDSIVGHVNADMIGRRGGATADFNSAVSGATGINRLYVIGPAAAPNNQSRTMGAILDSVNARLPQPFDIDRLFDDPNHPERYYYRSDHYNYAQKGIPILFFSTGFHEDYHKVTDHPDKIDYAKLARVTELIYEIARTVANREARPR